MTVGGLHLDLRRGALLMASLLGVLSYWLSSGAVDPAAHAWVPFALGIVTGLAGLLRLAAAPAGGGQDPAP